jgi:hypothetical protein
VVQIWPGQTVTCLHTISPGHIWTTLYFRIRLLATIRYRHFVSFWNTNRVAKQTPQRSLDNGHNVRQWHCKTNKYTAPSTSRQRRTFSEKVLLKCACSCSWQQFCSETFSTSSNSVQMITTRKSWIQKLFTSRCCWITFRYICDFKYFCLLHVLSFRLSGSCWNSQI